MKPQKVHVNKKNGAVFIKYTDNEIYETEQIFNYRDKIGITVDFDKNNEMTGIVIYVATL